MLDVSFNFQTDTGISNQPEGIYIDSVTLNFKTKSDS